MGFLCLVGWFVFFFFFLSKLQGKGFFKVFLPLFYRETLGWVAQLQETKIRDYLSYQFFQSIYIGTLTRLITMALYISLTVNINTSE